MYLIYILVHLIPPVVASIAFKYRSQLTLAAKISLFTFVTTYSLVMYSALVTDIYLSYKLEQFDLNGDGFFSGEEVSPEQEMALKKVVSDTGRVFAPITGLILSLALSLPLLLILKLAAFIKKHLTNQSSRCGKPHRTN